MPGGNDRIFYAPPELLARDTFSVPEDEAHHIANVLRAADGAELRFVDGDGGRAIVRVRATGRGALEGTVLSRQPREERRGPELHLAIAANKGTDFEEILSRLAEIGVHTIHPFHASRSVPKGDGEGARGRRRERMLRTGMKVAGSAFLTRLEPVVSWETILKRPAPVKILCDTDGEPWSPIAGDDEALALIGPEGGFTHEETRDALKAGFVARSLGARNLRATTAALLAAGFALGQDLSAPDGKNPSDR